ncbi:pentatricopeptide repeat-containing protein At5g39980, chloroplastic-like [Malus domestica]|uniref:pentatricopeptide repeat-containing protein At5g39980, chloroplastic-like n=1 Tax=Malus domestica TaxID=3750 RepID=UPI003976A82A
MKRLQILCKKCRRGVQLNAITYSTIKAGKLDRAAMLFQKLRRSGVKIDQVIVAYDKLGLVAHAKRLLHELKRPDNIPRGTAITILARAGRIEEATWVFRQAFEAGEVKDISVFVLNAYGKLREFERQRCRKKGVFLLTKFTFLTHSLYGARKDFKMVEALFERLISDPNINELHLVVASIYDRSNRLNDASRIMNKMTERRIRMS